MSISSIKLHKMRPCGKAFWLVLAGLLAAVLPARADEPVFGVQVPSVVAVDEAFQVVYSANAKVSSFQAPEFADFEVLSGPTPFQMHRTNIINGKRTSSFEQSYTYVLRPRKEGKFVIPAATAVIDGKTCSTREVDVEVVGSQQRSPDTGRDAGTQAASEPAGELREGDLKLVLELDRRRITEGEPVTATLKLYTRHPVSGFEDVRFPSFDGFWSQEVETPSSISFQRESVDGQIYDAAVLRKYRLIPQQTGTLTIEPSELVCLVPVRARQSRPTSIFDEFFDSGYRTVRKRLFTPEVRVEVKPLPAGAPASFCGGVGRFSLDVSLSRSSVKAHEAVSLVVKISGTGNVSLVEQPKVSLHPDFEVYDVKRGEDLRPGSGGTAGSRTFEIPFIPRSAGTYTIDPVRFAYYDTEQGKYVELVSKPLTLEVERGTETGAAVSGPAAVNRQDVKNLGEDIRYIRTDRSGLKRDDRLFCGSPLFYGVLAAALLAAVAADRLLARRIRLRRDVAGTRNRKARKVARARLRLAGTLLGQGQYTAYYEELHKAVSGYLSDKLMLPVSELNRERIRESLQARGAAEELLTRLEALLEACEFARYAPNPGTAAMERHYREAMETVSAIESL